MRSDISAPMLAAFESGEFKVANVVAIYYDTPLFLTDSPYPINLGPNLYQVSKGEMKLPDIEISMENKKNTSTITLPNIDRFFDNQTLLEGYTGKWITRGHYYWDKDGNDLGFLELWGGQTNRIEANQKEAKLSAAGYQSIFEVKNAIRTTEESHSRMFSNYSEDDDRTMWWAKTVRQFKVAA